MEQHGTTTLSCTRVARVIGLWDEEINSGGALIPVLSLIYTFGF
jgi:hypothetical protein